MPWRPRSELVPTDRRLDPYRARAGILRRGGTRVGSLFITIEAEWTRNGGHLWWRRWDPVEVALGYIALDEGSVFDDFVVGPEDLDDELIAWTRNEFPYHGEHLHVTWLDDAASRVVRESVFGLEVP